MSKLKKLDYIAKYGEEAWALESARRSEYMKQYYNTNKEYLKQYNKQWREEHCDYGKQWREEHPDYDKQWYQDNIEKRRQYSKDHKEERKEYFKQYRGTQLGRANNFKSAYISKDKKKGFSTDQVVDEDWIIENIFGSSCIYCGESDWQKLGADRIDNTKGHTPDNCVCACFICNSERQDKYSVEEFKEYRRTHPRKLGGGIEKSWEIVEQNGVRVIKKKR